ncbi:MAG TPA: 4'-phosphopantetheinyl transferase superfamily protein [Candidatus Polarisedimenticolaceae bacterium]|nr:4'-phosphopantetheinyl transferase superfamily protein [Candidatus Polarisedimenticolaceae bacterium]
MPAPDDCEVFWVDLLGEPVEDHLSTDERSRARTFVRPEDRASFVATRATLRELVGERIGVEPASIVFVTGEHGKPQLRDGRLHFNVAHCEGHAVIALRRQGPVGIDVEIVPASFPERDEIARRVLSPHEGLWLQDRPDAERTRDFMRLWVLKEAFAKCLGLGLGGPLRELEAKIVDGPPRVRWLGHSDRAFVASDLSPGEGVVSALVAETTELDVRTSSPR